MATTWPIKHLEMEDDDLVPLKASDFYARRMYWLPEDEDSSEEIMFPSLTTSNLVGCKSFHNDTDHTSQEIMDISMVKLSDGKGTAIKSSQGDGIGNEIYVAVGEEDLELVKWTLDHYVVHPTSSTVVLVHVYPPITYSPTPVGKFSIDKLNQEQAAIQHMAEERKRRKYLLQKYVALCSDAKVKVEILFLENDDTGQAMVDLVSNLEITKLIMGTNKLPTTWGWTKEMMPKGAYVKRKTAESCQVIVVYKGKRVLDKLCLVDEVFPSPPTGQKLKRRSSFSEKSLFLCFGKTSFPQQLQ